MIVVAGGSGLLGRQVVADLQARGESVRVLVRDADRARELLGAQVEVVPADVRRPGLAPACAGASVVISAVHGVLGGRGAGPDQVDRLGNRHLAEAAGRAGADVVLVSVLGAAVDAPVELSRAKYAAEQELRASGTGWTVVRAAPFLETWLQVLRDTAGRSGRPLVLGQGTRPVPFVSVVDVAAVVALAATSTSLRGEVLEVAGPALTMRELASAVQRSAGWAGPPRSLPRAVLRALAVVARPVSPRLARQNGLALLMDTVSLDAADPDLRERLALPPATTVSDLLSSSAAR